MNEHLDKSRAVRPGEEVDHQRLLSYLKEQVEDLHGPLTIEQYPAGFSNLTYRLTSDTHDLVLRRPPVGAKIKTAHDMAREYRILIHLHPVYKKVPRPIAFCSDESVLGAPFYVMERVQGIILRAQPPAGLDLSPGVMSRVSSAFVETLVEIHQIDYDAAGLKDLGQPVGYVSRQVAGWTKRYFNARTDDVPAIEKLASWLQENQPNNITGLKEGALIHNDFKYDNLVLSSDDLSKVVAVLDWEMATIGDPLMDLGTTIGYWVDPDDPEEWQAYGFGLTKLSGSLSRHDVLENYAKLSGHDVSNAVFYYAYGLLKIAVIVQQIYFRYRQGLTRDHRFASLAGLVKACGNLGLRAIEKRRIDRLGS